jgi:hypothetical protein
MKRRSPADGRRRKRSSDPPAPATSFASEMTKKLRNGRICFAIFGQKIEIYIYIYGLWLFNIAMGNGTFLDGLPGLNMVTFHGYVK